MLQLARGAGTLFPHPCDTDTGDAGGGPWKNGGGGGVGGKAQTHTCRETDMDPILHGKAINKQARTTLHGN